MKPLQKIVVQENKIHNSSRVLGTISKLKGRIKRNIEVNGKNHWTLFDSGVRNTYVINEAAKNLPIFDMPKSNHVALGGKTHNIVKNCRLVGKIDEYGI